ncbi:MAG: 4-hydroxythreonine-4-phosphate dehydrogenase PdxA [Deltaproteobacteria bacterium]|nr:MAG: 4-hydroxythreonine-4-phosphate dehydrogenase PdxA [Deltaproteobacteria bacterium]
MKRKPLIGITMGDPRGIGPEIIEKALGSPEIKNKAEYMVFGDACYFDFQNAKNLTPKECGELSGFYIEQATQAALAGDIDAIVTAPISKEHLHQAGYPYPGHTEFFAQLSKTKKFRMMMAGPSLKVVLVTIHEALKNVPTLLTSEKIFTTIQLTQEALQNWFGISKPKIAVAGLNPHAGEAGLFGDEETKIILPAIRKAQKNKIHVTGPLAADTVFNQAVRGDYDAVVVMYHDQGLIPLKLLHFDDGVNVTLGLPFVRTSPDHGTAFDIAGKGIATPSSMIAAIELSIKLSMGKL